MADNSHHHFARHNADMTKESWISHHWGYYDRKMPCTNDPGSCAYLDGVYHSHDLGMLYNGILWAIILGTLFIWGIGRRLWKPSEPPAEQPVNDGELQVRVSLRLRIDRFIRSTSSHCRRWLLPEFITPIFGHTTRLQVLILTILVIYLTIFSFVGMLYQTWVTPVKAHPGLSNTRTVLGPWTNRLGLFAYALTPFCLLLSNRESFLSIITGVPHQNFNFLHRWVGYIIFIQTLLHTIGRTIVDAALYNPQPQAANKLFAELFMIWGIIGTLAITFMVILSTSWAIKLTGYEFFRKSHYILAMLFAGACWGHWKQLACWLIPSLLIWFLDRGVRLVRTALLHYIHTSSGSMGFKCAYATLEFFHEDDNDRGELIRIDFLHPHEPWGVGQHFYLCFPQLSIWQSHPFTPFSLPAETPKGCKHSYIIRVKSGQTKGLADIARQHSGSPQSNESSKGRTTIPVILGGPYGQSAINKLTPTTNVLCIAGGTGIAFVLPVILSLVNDAPYRDRRIELIWIIRRRSNMNWIKEELQLLNRAIDSHCLKLRIFATRESIPKSQPGQACSEKLTQTVDEIQLPGPSTQSGKQPDDFTGKQGTDFGHPDLNQHIDHFLEGIVWGRTTVLASGPLGMISDIRQIVASHNCGGEVWRGNGRFDVDLICEDRVEW